MVLPRFDAMIVGTNFCSNFYKVRCCCPSCQAKRAVLFGHHIIENVFYPVPHHKYVFSLTILLRVYFKHDRYLLTFLCQCAYKSLLAFLREVAGLKRRRTRCSHNHPYVRLMSRKMAPTPPCHCFRRTFQRYQDLF